MLDNVRPEINMQLVFYNVAKTFGSSNSRASTQAYDYDIDITVPGCILCISEACFKAYNVIFYNVFCIVDGRADTEMWLSLLHYFLIFKGI